MKVNGVIKSVVEVDMLECLETMMLKLYSKYGEYDESVFIKDEKVVKEYGCPPDYEYDIIADSEDSVNLYRHLEESIRLFKKLY